MKHLLENPALYQLYQEIGGFHGGRVSMIREYLDIHPGARVIDIGCGPGHIVRDLPDGIDYFGFDIDERSITFANRHFGDRGTFSTRLFDAEAANELAGADVVMMNGVMHHIPDTGLTETLCHIRHALRPGGWLFTADGCYTPGQSRLVKWLLDNDRGEHVRDEAGYRRLLEGVFSQVEMHVREDCSRLPYTFAIGVARNHG